MKKSFLCIFITITFSINSFSQHEKDSLIQIIAATPIDTVKINALKDLALLLSRSQPKEAEKYCLECINLAEKTEFENGFIKCHNIMGIIKIYTSDMAEAISHFNISLEKAKEINDQQAIFRVFNNLGSAYITISDYDKAVKSFTEALSIAEKTGNQKAIAQCYSNIAIIHKDNGNEENAREYNKKALALAIKLNDKMMISDIYGNISRIELMMKKYSDAIESCKKAVEIKLSINDLYGAGINYVNLADYFLEAYTAKDSLLNLHNALDSSIYYYNKSLDLSKQIEDDQRICNAKLGLGQIALLQKDYAKAHNLFAEVIRHSSEIDMVEITMIAHSYMVDVNEAMGKYKEAVHHMRLYKSLSDSVYTSENQNSINEMEAKYQTEQKQKEIELLNRQKQISSIRTKFLAGVVLMMMAISALIYISLNNNRKHNKLLIQKNTEIYRQNQEIQEQSRHLSEANHEITTQKELIEKHHLKITDSINYAQYIQSAAMPSHEYLSDILPNHFIMFKPRDVVSGDFYFAKKIKNRIFLAVADCTGHGVPGAFMSMLGMAILNELVRRSEIERASDILSLMREQVKSSLQQKGEFGEQREGIDIALCILNEETREMSFAGAYNPLWISRKGMDMIEYKADRQPVGIYLKEKPFTEHKIQLMKDDVLYMFSDGLYSQFGGDHKEKLKLKRFQQMLIEVSALPFKKQHDALVSKYENWKMDEIQIDDILVMGIQV